MSNQASSLAEVAVEVLQEELADRPVDYSRAEHVPAAAQELLRLRKSAWPLPGDGGAQLVTAFALSVHRLRGRGCSAGRAFEVVSRALAARVAGRAARQ